MKLFKTIFGRVYAAPAPGAPDPDDDKANDGNEPGYPDNLREEDGNEPMECVYAGPEYFGVKDVPSGEPAGAPANCDDKDAPISCVYAGPRGFKRKRKPDLDAMGAVYAGPDHFAARNPTDGDPISGVYAGPMGMGLGMGMGQSMGMELPPIEDDGLPPQVMGIVPSSLPPVDREEREAAKVKCPGCGFRVPDGMKFCPECGSLIECEPKCPCCGAAVTPGSKFCPECGTRLEDTEKKEDA